MGEPGAPSDEDLRLVARRGSGLLERALAITILARRNGQLDRLQAVLEDHGDTAD